MFQRQAIIISIIITICIIRPQWVKRKNKFNQNKLIKLKISFKEIDLKQMGFRKHINKEMAAIFVLAMHVFGQDGFSAIPHWSVTNSWQP